MSRNNSRILFVCMLFVNGAEDDATTCAFSRECCEVNRTAVKAVRG
jgi:hypothetical protein